MKKYNNFLEKTNIFTTEERDLIFHLLVDKMDSATAVIEIDAMTKAKILLLAGLLEKFA